jgi:hypothetical protein
MSSASAPRTSPTMMRSGPHAQGVDQQIASGDAAPPFDIHRARFHPHDVFLIQAQFRRVLDRDDALGVGNRFGEHAEQR